jgi:SRSO17 transposase
MGVDAAEVRDADVQRWAAGLEEISARISPHFARRDAHQRAMQYLRALVSPVKRKNGWQLAEIAGERTPYGLQHLLDRAVWEVDLVRDDLREYVVAQLGDAEGMLILDETSFPKKGTKSAGVSRQYCGSLGKRENCQVGVLLAYAGPAGCAFLDRELYLPKAWTEDPARRQEAGIPEEVPFLTVAANQYVWVGWEQRRVDAVIRDLATSEWSRLSCGDGTKGPRIYDWARVALNCPVAGWERWALCRRSVAEPQDLAYFLVFVPSGTPLAEIVRAAGSRWHIEEAIAEAKGEVGLDHYEVRRWRGWYRHLTLALLAHAYLVVTRATAVAPAAAKGGMTDPHGTSSLAAFRQRRGLAG